MLWAARSVGTSVKIGLFKREKGNARVVAGEIAPDAWRKIIDKADANPNLKGVEVLAGPWILLDNDAIDEFFIWDPSAQAVSSEGEKRTGKYVLRDANDIWRIHPLFERLKRYLDEQKAGITETVKWKVWIKRFGLPTERHFYLGDNPQVTCIEHFHNRGPFQGATHYGDNSKVHATKTEDWSAILSYRGLCYELTPETIGKILEFPEVEFAPVRERPKEFELLPAATTAA